MKLTQALLLICVVLGLVHGAHAFVWTTHAASHWPTASSDCSCEAVLGNITLSCAHTEESVTKWRSEGDILIRWNGSTPGLCNGPQVDMFPVIDHQFALTGEADPEDPSSNNQVVVYGCDVKAQSGGRAEQIAATTDWWWGRYAKAEYDDAAVSVWDPEGNGGEGEWVPIGNEEVLEDPADSAISIHDQHTVYPIPGTQPPRYYS